LPEIRQKLIGSEKLLPFTRIFGDFAAVDGEKCQKINEYLPWLTQVGVK
jgi:hypothetical protein